MFLRQIAVAPMLDWTNRHCRYFHRLLCSQALLYTEMITTGAILYGHKDTLLAYSTEEHPIAVQLGGSDPVDLRKSAQIVAEYGYDEINLNVGCPSDRVQSGRFGACLMAEPELVAACVAEMQVGIPVTVKTRIGIDERDSYEDLVHFVQTVASANCKTFIIHARKAWLKGLSPKENREIPPLRYDIAQSLKKDFPYLEIIVNGGINTVSQALQHLQTFDGIMIGRAAYHNPYLLAELSDQVYKMEGAVQSRTTIIENYLPYMERQLMEGIKLSVLIRPIFGLFHGQAGANRWRRYLSEQGCKKNADISVVEQALRQVCT